MWLYKIFALIPRQISAKLNLLKSRCIVITYLDDDDDNDNGAGSGTDQTKLFSVLDVFTRT